MTLSLLFKRAFIIVIAFAFFKRSTLYRKLWMTYRASRLTTKTTKCVEDFKPALEAFKRNFLEGRELGAQLVLTVNGEVVVDTKAGQCEKTVFEDLTVVFSCTKVIESLAIAQLVDRGKLSYDEPVATYWPEFGKYFSPKITVSQLMKHQAGLSQIFKPLTVSEATEVFSSIEKLEKYLYETMKIDEDVARGETHTRYHAISRGFFVDVLIYKVDGRRGSQYIHEEIVAKVPGVEFYVGCPPKAQHRMAKCVPVMSLFETFIELVMHHLGIVKTFYHPGPYATAEELELFEMDFLQPSEVEMTMNLLNPKGRSFRSVMLVKGLGLGAHYIANSPEFRALPLLSVCGATNAMGLAMIGAELANDGGRLLSKEGLAKALRHDKPSFDEMLNKTITFVDCGWTNDRLGKDWIGWAGAGGSVFVFSPKYKASIGYIPTKLEGRTHKPNGTRILKAFEGVLEKKRAMAQLA